MSFKWLKRYMPRGLYGRAALILILPVVTLQLVVSIVFIQRHFEDVSEQMSTEVARELRVALKGDAALREALEFGVAIVPESAVPAQDSRQWYDLSGLVVTSVLRDRLEGVQRVLLPDDRTVVLFLRDDGTVRQVVFDRRRASASNPHQLLVHMVFFGGLMTVIAFVYLRNQLRPITRLARAAEAFGRGRTLPYAPSGAVEVRAAGHAFLDMRNRIERQIEQRTMMLSGVSHDMRTPLTRMKLALSMLDDAERAPLERDVADMERLLDAFLEFARGEAGAGSAEPTDPVALVTEIVEKARRAGTEVELALVEGHGKVALRPLSIARAVDNLIGNAVRYASQCEVSVLLTEKALRIRVEDDGPGILPEDRERAMRPFVRLDPARNQDRGSGVGLGLAIAADIARSHGGVLRLGASERLGGLCADIVIGR
ncbi:ATP-binding protein [Mesobacterium sp. TK19101]|uniref:histidine kinase n=1 Tax=Mesobacterium hydrothermale TaxID=3111907 RepID=A0ABU6HDS0_9RHOB|nr:ATP-binding protein [Mesobacterium sp. TK19101]MEC3860441.1 ATP-binding protein [Mesobacterium sp. TK19101]